MDNLVAGSLTINVTFRANSLRLDWCGKSNDRQPIRVLGPFFAKAAAQASEQNTGIEMHFEELEYFNSSTITSIIQLIQDLRHKKVPLTVVFASQVKWQKMGFDALRIFDKNDSLLIFKAI